MGINKTTITSNKNCYDIVAGPNRDTLFDACKYACNKNAKIPVQLEVAIGYTMPKSDPTSAYIPMAIADISIYGIEHEDGSGESFNLHGYCKADLNRFFGEITYTNYSFKAYYNTKRREGFITFTE